MEWNSLISAVVGGLIAVIPVLITIRNQSIERDKDRQEQRREAKTQLALELTRDKIKIIEDRINAELRAVDSIHTLSLKVDIGELPKDSLVKEIQSMFLNGKYSQAGESEMISDKLSYTLGADFYSEYRKFDDQCLEFWKMSAFSPYSHETTKKARLELSKGAAKLHALLESKLISVRDT